MRKQEQPSKRALETRAWRERETEDQEENHVNLIFSNNDDDVFLT